MFGRILYYDKKNIDEYKSLIANKKISEITERKVAKETNAALNSKNLLAAQKKTEEYKELISGNVLLEYSEFLEMLESRDDYFDFEINNYDISTIYKGNIIKIDAIIGIPEKFDNTNLIENYKDIILQQFSFGNANSIENNILINTINNAKANIIPITIQTFDEVFYTKINKEQLNCDYNDFIEIEEKSVTIVARISSGKTRKDIPYYDPMKDYLNLPRSFRRSTKGSVEGFEAFYADNDYRTLDVLAIYE